MLPKKVTNGTLWSLYDVWLVVLLGNKYTKKCVRANGKIDVSAVKPLCDAWYDSWLLGWYGIFPLLYSLQQWSWLCSLIENPGSVQFSLRLTFKFNIEDFLLVWKRALHISSAVKTRENEKAFMLSVQCWIGCVLIKVLVLDQCSIWVQHQHQLCFSTLSLGYLLVVGGLREELL